jgi:hypothetical protein
LSWQIDPSVSVHISWKCDPDAVVAVSQAGNLFFRSNSSYENMSISTAIQQHYRQEKVLLIDHSTDAVRDKFIQLSMTDIICGHLFNPITRYKLKIRYDRDSIYVDGLYGINMVPLVTKIMIQLSPSQNGAILNLVSQFPIKYIGKLLLELLL